MDIKKYMIEFDLPDPFPVELTDLIPSQRLKVDQMFTDGNLLTYTLAIDRSKLWVVMIAESESELLRNIDLLPMSKYLDYDYVQLLFHDSIHLMPSMSLN